MSDRDEELLAQLPPALDRKARMVQLAAAFTAARFDLFRPAQIGILAARRDPATVRALGRVVLELERFDQVVVADGLLGGGQLAYHSGMILP